ncbi:lipoprotein [Novispirillum sp. DQ9]|uniref:lipoprotein n=1 Tax=Novispirillum sp. DQ9 TaxID=3398612 RepID=UPI003C7B357E
MKRIILAALAALSLSACSTIVEGTTQNVTVMSEPAGAACELKGKNGTVAVVNPTPGSIQVPKSSDNISVLCKKEGYQTGAGTLASSFEGMTFGNIIFGGVIGVAVDASSGAMNKYPASLTVLLAPESFPSQPARDEYFDKLIATKEAEAAEIIKKIEQNCSGSAAECAERVKTVRQTLDREIMDIEKQRLQARVSA